MESRSGARVLKCSVCGHLSKHWNGKINLFVPDFDGTDVCLICKGEMRAEPYIDGEEDKCLNSY